MSIQIAEGAYQKPFAPAFLANQSYTKVLLKFAINKRCMSLQGYWHVYTGNFFSAQDLNIQRAHTIDFFENASSF